MAGLRRHLAAGTLVMASCTAARTIPAQVQQLPPGTTVPGNDNTASPASASGNALSAAEAKMAAQDWNGAVVLLRPLTTTDHPSAAALYDLGYCEESLNDPASAATAYTRASAADESAVLPRVALGLLKARTGDDTGAEPILVSAVALKGDASSTDRAAQAKAYRALARLHLAGSPERSRDELLLAIHMSREEALDTQLTGEIAEALNDDAAAEQAYARVLRASSADPEAAAQYARVLLREGKGAEASAVLDAGLTASPHNALLVGEKAGMLLHDKNFAAALPLLQELHQAHPADAAATRLLARAFVAAGQPALADPLFQQLTAADPSSGELLSEWADGLIRQKRNEEAEALLTRGLAGRFSTPTERARAAEELAFAASNTHHPETVLRAISIRSAVLPIDATSAFLSATAHDTLHQSREAAGSYRQFLELAHGKFPDEEWQAQQRLLSLSHAK